MTGAPDRPDETLAYYAANAKEYAARTNVIDMSVLYAKFEPLLAPGSLILDLGCGGGRDARHFASLGHQIIAVDPCPEMLVEARRLTPPDLGKHIQYMVGSAPDLPLPDSCCSAVWACASLLHLRRSAMARAIAECSRILVSGGVFLISVKRGSGEECWVGRWFTYWEMDELKKVVLAAGFQVLAADEMSSLDQGDMAWLHVLAKKALTAG